MTLTDFNPFIHGPSDAAHLIPGGDKNLFEHIRHEEVVIRYHDFLHTGPPLLKASAANTDIYTPNTGPSASLVRSAGAHRR